jgi:hypothetical protein
VKKKKRERTVEEIFPNTRARQAADEAIDKLDPKETMTTFLDTWHAAYVAAGGRSPFMKE